MRNQRVQAVQVVAPELKAAELSIDEALIQLSRLTGVMLQAHRTSRLAATAGHDAVVGAASTLNILIDACGQVVETHLRLGLLKAEIGLGAHMGGNLGDKPDQVVERDAPALQVVA